MSEYISKNGYQVNSSLKNKKQIGNLKIWCFEVIFKVVLYLPLNHFCLGCDFQICRFRNLNVFSYARLSLPVGLAHDNQIHRTLTYKPDHEFIHLHYPTEYHPEHRFLSVICTSFPEKKS